MDEKKVMQYEEVQAKKQSGILFLIIISLMFLIGATLFVVGVIKADSGENLVLATMLWVVGVLLVCVIAPILCCGLKIVRPNEALVFTLFGNYFGTLREPGFFFVNPFVSALNPAKNVDLSDVHDLETKNGASKSRPTKTISLKAMTLSNGKQKINDELGNPIIIGIVVVWRVENTAKAVFNVDNFKDYLAMQCDSALRDIVRIYPYDAPDNSDGEKSLRGSSKEIAQKLKEEIQAKVDIAGLEIIEARITHLSYAEEIAAAMLQRQQASAIIDARQMIVEGAVGMVKMALEQLAVDDIVELDEERKAAMVSNLLVVLSGNKDPQPIVNSGSIY